MSCTCSELDMGDGSGHTPGCPLYAIPQARVETGAHPSQDALLKKVAEFANKVTMQEAVNSELWLLGCKIYDEIEGEIHDPKAGSDAIYSHDSQLY